jgi:predicted anti-sigma-YlaC factor YlaD
MKCDRDKLIAYYYGELDYASKVLLDSHLISCNRCRQDLKEAADFLDILAKEGKPIAPHRDFMKYLDGIYRKAERERLWRWILPFPRYIYAGFTVAVVLVLIIGGTYFYRYQEDSLLSQNYEVIQYIDLIQDVEIIQSLEEFEIGESINS